MEVITEDQFKEAMELTNQLAPKRLPLSWAELGVSPDSIFYGQKAYERKNGLRVIFTADNLHGDGKTWIHVSMSRATRLPSYEDMTEVKKLFIGDHIQALQIFPKIERHVNIHPFCLHLWAAVEGDDLPDFGKEGTI